MGYLITREERDSFHDEKQVSFAAEALARQPLKGREYALIGWENTDLDAVFERLGGADDEEETQENGVCPHPDDTGEGAQAGRQGCADRDPVSSAQEGDDGKAPRVARDTAEDGP